MITTGKTGKVVVLGASPDHMRFSYKAVKALRNRNYQVIALGARKGTIADVEIDTGKPLLDDVDTVLLYINPERQKRHYEYILSLKPKRIIFNPGTQNAELAGMAERDGIQVVNQCSLVMLGADTF
ncbi:MAG: CoA-binding protein [Bacteroidales bacterium]|nr:CoA-binding protein [Bacteroidales bacterium]